MFELKVTGPTVDPYNFTHVKVKINVLIDNHSGDTILNGVDLVRIYDLEGRLVGSGKMDLNINPKTHFEQIFPFLLSIPKGDIEEFMSNNTKLAYRVTAEFQSHGIKVLAMEKKITVNLGVPIKDLKIGMPAEQPYNSSHIELKLPFSFTDDSGFIEVKGTVMALATDRNGNRIGSTSPKDIDVTPKTSLNLQLTFYIDNSIQI